jgi:hypothetical protein
MKKIIFIASLPLLMGAYACGGNHAARQKALEASCGAICDELNGAWIVTVSPGISTMVACSDPRSDQTQVTFPTDATGLGEVTFSLSPPGNVVEFHSAEAPERIAGTVDPATLAITFDLPDGQGNAIRCSGTLEKFSNPAGSEGWTAATSCDTGTVGAAQCRLDPPMKISLLIQRILPVGSPSP